jgi:hypothetical protein
MSTSVVPTNAPLPLLVSVHVMSLSLLATVELQLCMQFCELKSLLTLARCSRFTRACASNEFAWQMLNPLPLLLHKIPADADLSASFLQFVNVSVTVESTMSPSRISSTNPTWSVIKHIPRLRILRVMHRSLPPDFLPERFGLPACANLQELHLYVDGVDWRAARETFCLLHQLQVLSLRSFGERCSLVEVLHRLRSLRELRLERVLGFKEGFVSVGECASLHRLELAHIREECLQTTLHFISLQSLEHLTLEGVHAQHGTGPFRAPSPFDWDNIFRGLIHLRFLELKYCHGVDCILSAVGLLPCLEELHLLPDDFDSHQYGSPIPTVQRIGDILSAKLSLQIVLRMPLLEQHIRRAFSCASGAAGYGDFDEAAANLVEETATTQWNKVHSLFLSFKGLDTTRVNVVL